MRASLVLGMVIVALMPVGQRRATASEHWLNDPASSRKTQEDAYRRIPFVKLTPQAAENIRDVADRPSFFRRMPTQTFTCDPEMFTFLVRYPEVLVNIWDVMDITRVSVKRLSPFVFQGHDGAGTMCKCDLVFGNPDLHIYYGKGSYSGSMAPREITGRCVCILHSKHTQPAGGKNGITGTMDVYLKLDNLGADLITRTLGPFVGKTADYNFVESAKFVSQISGVCENNPLAAQQLAARLDKVEPAVRERFAQLASSISASHVQAIGAENFIQRRNSEEPLPSEISHESISQLVDLTSVEAPSKSSVNKSSPPTKFGGTLPQKSQIYMRR